MVLAGDIATGGLDDEATAALVERINPDYVLTAGDHAYQDGNAADFADFYEPTWGRFRSRTKPAPGNHEYLPASGNPPYYFTYFAGQLPPDNGGKYYAFNVGTWRAYSLNCEIDCSATSPQVAWLRNDLATNGAGRHKLAYLHRPRYSCGPHGSSSLPAALWQELLAARADVVVAAHDHRYERFARMGNNGLPSSSGILGFVAGTGGGYMHPETTNSLGCAYSQASNATKFGVLKLTLGSDTVEWEMVAIDDTVYDSGTVPTLDAPNDWPPAAALTVAPAAGATPLVVSADAGGSTDTDATPISSYTFSWGDGTTTGPQGSSVAQHTYTTTGSFNVTVSVRDTAGLSSSVTRTVTATPAGGGPVVTETTVAASADDAEESSSGSVSLTSSDLELTTDGTSVQTVGMRFKSVSVPPDATVTKAYVQFQTDEVSTDSTNVVIRGHDTDATSSFAISTRNLSNRPRTDASVSWSPPPWSTVGAHGTDQRTPDLSAVVTEIVRRPGWANGNPLALFVTGTGRRTAEAFDDFTAPPVLHVEYTPSASPAPTPTATASPTPTPTPSPTPSPTPTPTPSPSPTPSPTPSPSPVATSSVSARSDDSEERISSGAVATNSPRLDLGAEGKFSQLVGLRFPNVQVPVGATITSASVQFSAATTSAAPTQLTIRGQATDSAAGFTTATRNISSRLRTTASVAWNAPSWQLVGERGAGQRTPDLTSVISAITARSGWRAGNAMALIIDGSGARAAAAVDAGSAGAAVLRITYTP